MHTTSVTEMGSSVPAFLGKLWRLVEDPETDDLICWAPNGRSFFIRNQAQFARELLPHYYKHNNMASFVRQLNMYGFHKKVSVELGGLKCDKDEMEFAHQYFCKDHPYLLDHIKRKIASNKTQDPAQTPLKPELMNRMLTEVRSMRGRQEHFDSRLGAMKRENEALWRELALLRQKHHQQQKIVNKLIHFFFSMVQSRNGGLSMKRPYPLMIDDSNQSAKQSKIPKMQAHQSPTGPAIHELDASDPDLESEYIVAEMLDNNETPTVQSPDHHSVSDENVGEYISLDELVSSPQNVEICQDPSNLRKRIRGKKKGRKSKVPIKILIPSSGNNGEAREETVLLVVPRDKLKAVNTSTTASLSPSSSITTAAARGTEVIDESTKPKLPKRILPPATVRSSKLAAMVANIKKSEAEQPLLDLDLDTSFQGADDELESRDDSLVKLEDMLIVPELLNDNYEQEIEKDSANNVKSSGISNNFNTSINNGSPEDGGRGGNGIIGKGDGGGKNQSSSPDIASINNGSFGNVDFMTGEPTTIVQDTTGITGQDNGKNMSLRCVSPSGAISENTYRLGSKEDIDVHLDTVQSELENLREMLRNEGYSIDANTLLGLFGSEDPMSFGIPVNPDLDPHTSQEKEPNNDSYLNADADKGELMAYSQASNLLDFDDDMFLEPTSVSPHSVNTDVTNIGIDSLEYADSKGNIFDSLIAANNTNSPHS